MCSGAGERDHLHLRRPGHNAAWTNHGPMEQQLPDPFGPRGLGDGLAEVGGIADSGWPAEGCEWVCLRLSVRPVRKVLLTGVNPRIGISGMTTTGYSSTAASFPMWNRLANRPRSYYGNTKSPRASGPKRRHQWRKIRGRARSSALRRAPASVFQAGCWDSTLADTWMSGRQRAGACRQPGCISRVCWNSIWKRCSFGMSPRAGWRRRAYRRGRTECWFL